MTRTDAAAVAAGVPDLVIRRYAGEADIPELVRVTNAELEADGIPERRNVAEVTTRLRHASASFDPRLDLLVAEIDGTIVAHGRVEWVDTTDGLREYRLGCSVDHTRRRRGIGRALHRLRRGWLDSVFTRRRWRKRGVARALIARSLHLLAEHGMDTAALGVDADNPSGALGLYESFGFVVTERSQAWRRPLDSQS